MLLPISEYAPGKILPPHLSPFVDPQEEGGYKPERQLEIERLRGDQIDEELPTNDLEEEKVK